MKRCFALLAAVFLPIHDAQAQDYALPINAIVEGQILSGFKELRDASDELFDASQATCDVSGANLRDTYEVAFLSWAKVSHFRFGPTEELNRGFALAFWPDPRGKTSKTLRGLIAAGDAAVLEPDTFNAQSVAIRGFYALDYMLYENSLADVGDADYRCALMRAVTRDIKRTTTELHAGWQAYAPELLQPKTDSIYRTEQEVTGALFNAVLTGMQFTSEMRLGRPLGTPDRPRPKRAEARRSGLSRDLTREALKGTVVLAKSLASGDAELVERFERLLTRAENDLAERTDPSFANVSDPIGRLRLESIKTTVDDIWRMAALELGPLLGVAAGFNSLDGD